MLRIVAGKLKGRVIKPRAQAPGFRPTTERVREAMFSSLQYLLKLEGSKVLDLYAGSGALGFEALSRGASYVVFVEKNAELAGLISQTARAFGVESQTQIVNAGVEEYLAGQKGSPRLGDSGEGKFNLLLADPPYEEHPGELLLESLLASGLLGGGSIIALEGEKVYGSNLPSDDEQLETQPGERLEVLKTKNYGKTRVTYLRVV